MVLNFSIPPLYEHRYLFIVWVCDENLMLLCVGFAAKFKCLCEQYRFELKWRLSVLFCLSLWTQRNMETSGYYYLRTWVWKIYSKGRSNTTNSTTLINRVSATGPTEHHSQNSTPCKGDRRGPGNVGEGTDGGKVYYRRKRKWPKSTSRANFPTGRSTPEGALWFWKEDGEAKHDKFLYEDLAVTITYPPLVLAALDLLVEPLENLSIDTNDADFTYHQALGEETDNDIWIGMSRYGEGVWKIFKILFKGDVFDEKLCNDRQ